MSDPAVSIALMGASLVVALSVMAVAILKGWRGWLDLRRLEIDRGQDAAPVVRAGGRIEIADLKERVRKLEAIAEGIDV
ncbi:hypothetical protein [Sphingomonas sp.]|jgi:hypothetical protein|uniref:hypothetical protein n=1 Tax=Sphingomonas sp. TaxID=28214 RepID=UPI0025D485F4|nr:hypothetical protein [Sphingomonas sp.]